MCLRLYRPKIPPLPVTPPWDPRWDPRGEKSMFYKVLSDYLSRHHSAVQVEANGELSVIGQYQADQDDQVISLPQDIQSDLPLTKGHRKIQLD